MYFVEVEPEQMAVCGYVRLASLSECIQGHSIAVGDMAIASDNKIASTLA